jgi:hypothetical protein
MSSVAERISFGCSVTVTADCQSQISVSNSSGTIERLELVLEISSRGATAWPNLLFKNRTSAFG